MLDEEENKNKLKRYNDIKKRSARKSAKLFSLICPLSHQ